MKDYRMNELLKTKDVMILTRTKYHKALSYIKSACMHKKKGVDYTITKKEFLKYANLANIEIFE